MKTKWFHYSQNNSGGNFVYDENAGISTHVVIEAKTVDEANERAENIGLYFDGCSTGMDCSCCGDRWYPAYGDGNLFPSVYGKKITHQNLSIKDIGLSIKWIKGYEIFVHPLKGKFWGAGNKE